ncbi:conserved hypothetical protein [Leishmania infantum JPCM5]|uniref:Fungal_tRNA_ligase_phosphodiesterase_domain_conta ining_protein_-_putative n=2 Tax=Leishmania infantum TaxID=5671 RepID=A0A6L0XM99_LEIIN|nr:conserved hypothetical protein [Leishmania infantum JPCM5]CAC9520401.1 Fungal_tRNA_ligase_phosphodiesterase_domain_containing_protein_-_putative [Leishmania infantum]CAM70569.1 conserved hypothetical protein [Leishmania infantum JPCM5]SUZ44446.1 Fungal_tRNA_ligase_phosphodiesterase_domain_containing_protein_-_putative [Leishmania infantum]|eukprot:XP_001467511.1 conserved hypothetical protein [Leishmania infantum JPCM5]
MRDTFRGSSGRGGKGRRGGRGRQGRGGGRGPSSSSRPPAASPNTSGGKREQTEHDVESIVIPNAFDASFAHVSRCREKGRLFRLPLPAAAAAQRDFVVVERTISGIDEVVYSRHRDVWERLPRGNARVYVKSDWPNGTPTYSLVGAIDGLRKFGCKDSTYGYPDAVQTVIAMEEENGECGHLSAFVVPPAKRGEKLTASQASCDAADEEDTSRRYWVIGSKDVHIVLDYAVSEDCLHYYSSLGCRFSQVVKISRLWKAMLAGGGASSRCGDGSVGGCAPSSANADARAAASRTLTPAQARAFHETLYKKMWTSCFVAIFSDSQHLMVDSGANELRFYAVTLSKHAFEAACTGRTDLSSNKAPEPDDGDCHEETADAQNEAQQHSRQDGLCVPVAEAEALCAGVGLAFSRYSAPAMYGSPEYVQRVRTINRRIDLEGCVMYGADASGKVVRLWKEKSYPYAMERATREAVTNHKLNGNGLQAWLKKKLDQQQPELRDHLKEWEVNRMPWLLHFAAWLQMTRRLTPNMQRNELLQLRKEWLSLQKEFQTAMDSDPKLRDACGQYRPDPVQWGSGTHDLDVIKFVGPQGCGKSTLSRALYVLLQASRYQPRWVNQDEAGKRDKFLALLRQATQAESTVTHLIIDKMNLDAKMNHDYDNLPLSLTVTWFHPDGEKALYDVCIARVLGRGNGHRSIRVDPNLTQQERDEKMTRTRSFVRKAVRDCETPRDPPELVLELDVTSPLSDMVRMIWEKLQANGTHTLPPVTDEDVNEAISLAHQYESHLHNLPRAPTYACIGIEKQQDVEKLLALVPPEFTAGQVVQREFHVTTKYFGGEMDPVAFVTLAKLLGQSVTLTLESVVADADGVAITVRRDDAHYPCANPIPHITISNRKGVPPKYSNDLISPTTYPGDPAKRKVLQLPANCTVMGIFEFR